VWRGFTLEWYRKLLSNEVLLGTVRNSLIVGAAATAIATVFGTLAALALGRYRFRGEGFTRNLLYLPIIIPEIVIGAALVTFFGVAGLRLSLATVVIAHVVFSISYVAIVVRAGLSGFDRSLEEAALDLGGAPGPGRSSGVTLPLILPGVVAGRAASSSRSRSTTTSSRRSSPGVGRTTLPLQIYSMLKVGRDAGGQRVSTLLLAADRSS
jgi:spermidine/putrescine transport system permease protein